MKKYSLIIPAALTMSAALGSVAGASGAYSQAGVEIKAMHSAAVVQVAASDADIKGARDFIDSMTQRGIAFLSDETLDQDGRKKEFEKLLNDSFDIKTIARFALGTNWRKATEKERSEYLKLFNQMIVDVYSNRFKEYQGQSIEVSGARAEGNNDVIVNSMIVDKNKPSVKVDWRVRNKGGSYKVVDVIVEGVSMSVTQRSDFSSVIQRGGGDISVLLDHMRK